MGAKWERAKNNFKKRKKIIKKIKAVYLLPF